MRPPERIPDELFDRFTMNGLAVVEYRYFDESQEGEGGWVWTKF